jgi:phosphoglucosamine mutase
VLEDAVVSGILSMGAEPILVGELPTPGVAFITRDIGADAGIVISASHNPYQYNGFKIFSHEGYKPTDEMESEIEALILEGTSSPLPEVSSKSGEVKSMNEVGQRYLIFLRNTLPEKFTLKDMKVVLDCANGATYRVAPTLLERLDAQVEALFASPDGKNINQGCGSQHPETLRGRVLETGAHVGLAFDGDGDRLIAVDEKGNVLTGDQILAICAKTLKNRAELQNDIVVSTMMSNMGLGMTLKELGIEHVLSKVGDRYVLEEMRARKAVLGGEASGHIVFLQHHTTGDGLLSAMQLLSAVKASGQSLSQLASMMTIFPQTMINVAVKKKPELSSVPALAQIIQQVEKTLGDRGRVLLRYSGTEPVCRIMVEGESQEEIEAHARQIAEVVRRELT